jgi:hypothetical protein
VWPLAAAPFSLHRRCRHPRTSRGFTSDFGTLWRADLVSGRRRAHHGRTKHRSRHLTRYNVCWWDARPLAAWGIGWWWTRRGGALPTQLALLTAPTPLPRWLPRVRGPGLPRLLGWDLLARWRLSRDQRSRFPPGGPLLILPLGLEDGAKSFGGRCTKSAQSDTASFNPKRQRNPFFPNAREDDRGAKRFL